MSSFGQDSYSHINTALMSKVITLLKQISNVIEEYLPDFFENLIIYECGHNWHVDFRATGTLTDFSGVDNVTVEEITAYHGKFPVYYKGVRIVDAHIIQEPGENSGEVITTMTNRWETLTNLKEKVCSEHKQLRTDCGCKMDYSGEAFRELAFSFTDAMLHGPIGMKEKGGMAPAEPKSSLSKDEEDSIVNGLGKQLGIPKREMRSLVKKVVGENPGMQFEDIVNVVLRSVR